MAAPVPLVASYSSDLSVSVPPSPVASSCSSPPPMAIPMPMPVPVPVPAPQVSQPLALPASMCQPADAELLITAFAMSLSRGLIDADRVRGVLCVAHNDDDDAATTQSCAVLLLMMPSLMVMSKCLCPRTQVCVVSRLLTDRVFLVPIFSSLCPARVVWCALLCCVSCGLRPLSPLCPLLPLLSLPLRVLSLSLSAVHYRSAWHHWNEQMCRDCTMGSLGALASMLRLPYLANPSGISTATTHTPPPPLVRHTGFAPAKAFGPSGDPLPVVDVQPATCFVTWTNSSPATCDYSVSPLFSAAFMTERDMEEVLCASTERPELAWGRYDTTSLMTHRPARGVVADPPRLSLRV
jgi:hypothetical protein